METMGMRLSVVKQSFFGHQGQYGRLVTRANSSPSLWLRTKNGTNTEFPTQMTFCKTHLPHTEEEGVLWKEQGNIAMKEQTVEQKQKNLNDYQRP